jgi:hypothetical protein
MSAVEIQEPPVRWEIVKREGLKITLKRSTDDLRKESSEEESPKKKRSIDKTIKLIK